MPPSLKGHPRGGFVIKKLKNSYPATPPRDHEAGVHRIQAIFTIGYPAAVWDVAVSDDGEFIAAAVDLA